MFVAFPPPLSAYSDSREIYKYSVPIYIVTF